MRPKVKRPLIRPGRR